MLTSVILLFSAAERVDVSVPFIWFRERKREDLNILHFLGRALIPASYDVI